jgi:hypothetical protein
MNLLFLRLKCKILFIFLLHTVTFLFILLHNMNGHFNNLAFNQFYILTK